MQIVAPTPIVTPAPLIQPQPPEMWAMILWNDPVTPYQYVVDILREVFSLNKEEAISLMMAVHQSTKGVIGLRPKDVAETLVDNAMAVVSTSGYPLQITVEKAE